METMTMSMSVMISMMLMSMTMPVVMITTIQARVTRGIAVSAPSAADVSIRLTL